MAFPAPEQNPLPMLNRREFLDWNLHGLGTTALLTLLSKDGILQTGKSLAASASLSNRPRAKRAVQICLIGGMSHLDSFDYKPSLQQYHGKSLNTTEKPDIFFGKVGLLRQNDWRFTQRGNSGLWISDLFPHIAKSADDLTLIRSMVSDSANHTPALFLANSGFQFNGFPSLGTWLSYGLGSETESLPTYVVLPDRRGGPNGGASNWSNGFLPAQNQGVVLQGGRNPVRDLFPSEAIQPAADRDSRRFLQIINEKHLKRFGTDELLSARIRSYALASRMQQSIPDIADFSKETDRIQKLYGINNEVTNDAGRRCLLARRLLERGVRFVQIFSGGPIAGSPRASWDAHESVKDNHGLEASRIDRPVAALIQDLKQRGMLDDTLIIFTTEFGRTPFAQSDADKIGSGRDHNRYGFCSWMAGGGLKAGSSYGATDDIGWKVAENPVTWNDFHATILHLFGIDHENLTFYHNGIQRRLTNVHGQVLYDCLA